MGDNRHQSVMINGWEVHVVGDDDGHLNIDVRHEDGTEVLDTGESPGAGQDFHAIGFRLTTMGIEQEHTEDGGE